MGITEGLKETLRGEEDVGGGDRTKGTVQENHVSGSLRTGAPGSSSVGLRVSVDKETLGMRETH